MSFRELLFGGGFPVALEITPPQKPLRRVLLRRARLLGEVPSAINVIERPGRQGSLDASLELKAAGFEPVWHLAVRGMTPPALAESLTRAGGEGIRQVLCVLGDGSSGPREGGVSVRDAIAAACGTIPGLLVGATLNQYVPDQQAARKNLLGKLRAGARYVQTQPVFSIAQLEGAFAPVLEAHPGVRLMPMVMPLLSFEAAARMEQRLGVALPGEVHRRLAAGPESAWSVFDEIVAGVATGGLAAGIAVMTFETDPPPEMAERIVESLRRAGVVHLAGASAHGERAR